MAARRTFLKTFFGLCLLLFYAPVTWFRKSLVPDSHAQETGIPQNPESPVMPGTGTQSPVVIEPCPDYDAEKVYHAVQNALKSIQYEIKPGLKVLLKPNIMAQNTPDQAASTHPAVAGAVCRLFKENGCSVTIGDSSAFYQGGATRRGFETTGMAGVAKRYGAKLLPFEATRLRKITSGRVLNPFYITEAVFEHDLVVDLPKLKIHRLARYSGAIKNLYGCVVGGTKQLYHQQFQERPDYQEFWGKPLVDVWEAVRPGLTVMDAVVGLDKDGPAANGEPRKTGLILASENGPALDVVACRVIGFDPLWVPAVREAVSRGHVSPGDIPVNGKPPSIPYTKLPDLKPKKGLSKKMDDYLFSQFVVTPRVKKGKCDKCGNCIKDCAAKAISPDKKGFPAIDYDKCIYCYCCSEYCTRGAVALHGGATNHLVRGIRRIMKL